MSEEIIASAQEAADNVSQETVDQKQETAQEETKSDRPDGWDQVDFSPEQQKRFNRLYAQVKENERREREKDSILKEQFEIIEQLRKGQGQIIEHLQATDYQKAETTLKQQRKDAYERGDLMAVDDINDKLTEIKLQRKIDETKPKEQQQPKRSLNGDDVVTAAVSKGAISEADAAAYKAWANEVDENGNLLRPWVNEYDPRNKAAAFEGGAVFRNPQFTTKSFAEKLKEIDRRMGVVNKNLQGGSVLGAGNLTQQTKRGTVKLTPYQESVAIRTQFAGRGKSPQDHIEAYRKQVEEMRGVRK